MPENNATLRAMKAAREAEAQQRGRALADDVRASGVLSGLRTNVESRAFVLRLAELLDVFGDEDE